MSTFNPAQWADRFRAACEEATCNSMMDSGWSASVATRCESELLALYRELFAQLADVPVISMDFFSRPKLAAALAAVHAANKPAPAAPKVKGGAR